MRECSRSKLSMLLRRMQRHARARTSTDDALRIKRTEYIIGSCDSSLRFFHSCTLSSTFSSSLSLSLSLFLTHSQTHTRLSFLPSSFLPSFLSVYSFCRFYEFTSFTAVIAMRFDPLGYCFGRKNKINGTEDGKTEELVEAISEQVSAHGNTHTRDSLDTRDRV